ncbi:MAG: MFS transporter [Clostridia bacterium]|nr:MFS transporter [Clostridia bacterium]
MIFKDKKVANAVYLGVLRSVAYLAVYFARNILSVVTPQMLEGGAYGEEYIGSLSSLFFGFYAVGQLINGLIGDRIKTKYMISFGLFLAGVSNAIFLMIAENGSFVASIAYGITGFFLSMIYAPMTKVVAENTEPIYATRCSMGYTFASFFGSPVAGIVAATVVWQGVFVTGSAILVAMALSAFVFFTIFERKGVVKYGQYKPSKQKGQGIGVLFGRYHIVKFTLISMITGVIRTTVVFWMPTYLSDYLKFTPDNAALIFTVATFVISLTTFIVILIYERLGHNMDLTILIMFISSSVMFALLYFVKLPLLNIILLVLAIMSSNGAATMLWSRYCPSLRDTGMVSSVTGFLDFVSYMSASLSSTLFANAVSGIGWGNLILVWCGLVLLGVIVALPYGKIFRREKNI